MADRGTSMYGRWLPAILVVVVAACGVESRDFRDSSIPELHDAMQRGELRSEDLVAWHLDRIAAIDGDGPELRSVVEVNPDAITTARALDAEWTTSGPRGPLHGIPVLLKANIDTADRMATSAGSLALADHVPPRDAFLVSRLRDAGAVILGKANLSEWANFRSTRSSSGWSSVGGQTKNPHAVLRNPCGSSSGSAVAVAASLTVVSIGTETDGSIVCPAGSTGIVGIKPTVGLVSRSGIIPIAHSQDTAGPMARTVRDAAILLSALTGTDSEDEATLDAPESVPDFAANLAADRLTDRRIGVIRNYSGAGSLPAVDEILEAGIATLETAGAEVVDPVEIDADVGDAEFTVLLYEFKADLNAYLEASGAPYASLAELIDFNEAHAAEVMPIFGQEIFVMAEAKGPLTDDGYLQALDESRGAMRAALDAVLAEYELDALVAPTNGPAWMTDHILGDNYSIGSSSYAAVSGYPAVTVPAGDVSGMPVGLSFIGPAWSEKALIEMAYAFEQAAQARIAPPL